MSTSNNVPVNPEQDHDSDEVEVSKEWMLNQQQANAEAMFHSSMVAFMNHVRESLERIETKLATLEREFAILRQKR